jgi:hypothetical protein
MKVYVLTAGEYSDYGIYGVTLDHEEAERWLEEHSKADFFYPSIEIYETESKINPFPSGRTPFVVTKKMGGSHKGQVIVEPAIYGITHPLNDVFTNGRKGDVEEEIVLVMAKDENHAGKIAYDLFAKYDYQRKVEELGEDISAWFGFE